MHPGHLFPSVHIKNQLIEREKEDKMSGIMHKIEETLHIGGKKEEHKSETRGEHKGEYHGEHKPEHGEHKEGFVDKIHGDGHGEGVKKKEKKKKKEEHEHGHDGHSSSDSDSD